MAVELTPEIQERLLKYLETVESAVKSSGEFVVEQAPLVVQEIIVWRRAESTVAAASCAILCVVFACLMKTWTRSANEASKHEMGNMWPDRYVAAVVAASLIICGSAAGLVVNTSGCMKAWCAPRLVVLEEIGKVVK